MRREQDWRRNLEKPKFKHQVEREGERLSPEARNKQGIGVSREESSDPCCVGKRYQVGPGLNSCDLGKEASVDGAFISFTAVACHSTGNNVWHRDAW